MGMCSCKSNYEVCGTNGLTYGSGCALRSASQKSQNQGKESINIQNKGRCPTAPIIVTAPGEIYNVSGSQVYLSCEAVSVPTPVLTWKKISPMTREEEGSYECHATNSQGQASAVGTIHLVRSLDDIIVKTVTKEDEL